MSKTRRFLGYPEPNIRDRVRLADWKQGLTVTLMLRSVGALIFGTVSDRYGRKWPMIINLTLFIFLELASGFCNTLSQFLAVRSLYGIAMGGKMARLTPEKLF